MKKVTIKSCSQCPWNEHGQEMRVPIMRTYLGVPIQVFESTIFGGPMLYCKYRPWENLRDNLRGGGWKRHVEVVFIIWASSWDDDTEFERQLNGFPARCPLEDD